MSQGYESCLECEDTGISYEHEKDCPWLLGLPYAERLGPCCFYSEKYCRCPIGRDLKRRED